MIESIQENKNILNHFAALVANGRLAHAYLFIGPDYSGKTETAKAVSKLVNCIDNESGKKDNYCDKCTSCLKINASNHPDVSIVDVEEGDQSIKIASIREIVSKSQLMPFEARKKIFIIRNIENLTPESSNALLKTLEEPSKNSLLILTTSVPEASFSTVRSRCHAVHFFPLSKEKVDKRLKKDAGSSQEESHFLAYFCDGCFGKAQRLSSENFFEEKNSIIDNLVLSRNNDLFIKELISDKERTKEALDIVLSWFRDLLLLKTGVDKLRLMNIDRFDDLSKMAGRYSFENLQGIIKEVVNTKKLLDGNFNIKIPLILLREKIWIR